MTDAIIFPGQDGVAGWVIVIGLTVFSLLAFIQHGCVVKRWKTHTSLDVFYDRRRAKFTQIYFGTGKANLERAALLVQFLSGSTFGLWAIGALLFKLSGSDHWLEWLGVALIVVGVFPFVLAWKRAKFGQPDRIKPKWLLEEESRRRGGVMPPD